MPLACSFRGGASAQASLCIEICYLLPAELLVAQSSEVQGRLRIAWKLVGGFSDVSVHVEAFSSPELLLNLSTNSGSRLNMDMRHLDIVIG